MDSESGRGCGANMTTTELKALRVKLGHSQASLAAVLGVSTRHYIRYETGHAEIPAMMLLALRVVPSRLSQRKQSRKSK